jgi:hypothetical protein
MSEEAVARRIEKGEGVPGALHEGMLALLDKKIKDWVDTYYAIVPMLTDKKGTGHGDFAYMLQSAASLKDAISGNLIEKINLHGAQVFLECRCISLILSQRRAGHVRASTHSAAHGVGHQCSAVISQHTWRRSSFVKMIVRLSRC